MNTYFVWERSTCTYLAVKPGGSCSLTLYYPPHSCVDAALTAGFFNNSPTACGAAWGGTCGVNFSCSINLTGDSVGGCSSGETGCTSTEHTGAHPPATISGNINCSQVGEDGWCVGASSLALSANEPVGGYSILLIEGTRNGETFACPGSSCNVPLIEGQNDFTYWALSSWGDSSLMGTSGGKVDSQPPQVSLSGATSFCPGCGESLSVTLGVADAASGVSSWTLSLDGATLTSGSGSSSQTYAVPSAGLSAGAHTLSLSAADVAGNANLTTLTFTLLLPTPTYTPVPTSTPKGGGSQPENTPAGQPTDQSGSSNPLFTATSTNLASTPASSSATQMTDSLTAIPATSSRQEGPASGGENTNTTQNGSSPMPPGLAEAVLWGSMAAGAIGFTTAYVLDIEKKRKEEEARARAEAERTNAEARAREQEQWEYQAALKAVEEARLNQEAEIRFLETADMSEAEKLALYKQTPEYQAYQARMAEWEQLQASMQAIEQTDMTEAERLAAYKQTPEYKVYQTRMAEWEAKQHEAAKEEETPESWLQTAWNWTNDHLISFPIEWTQQTIIQPFLQNVPPAARKVIAVASALSLTTLLALCVGSTPPPTPDANATRTSAFQTKAADTAYVLSLTPTPDPCSGEYCVGQTYYAGDLVNLRNSPAGEVVGSLRCGDSVTVVGGFELENLHDEEFLWAQVDASTGQKGVWIAISLFSAADQEPVKCSPVGNRTEEEGYIATEGDGFAATYIEAIGQAGDNIASAFWNALGTGYAPEEAWNLVFRDTTVTFVDTGLDCYNIGVSYFGDYGFTSKCWAASGPAGQVYVSTEFTNGSHRTNDVTEWAIHETGHEVDLLMTNVYDPYMNNGDYYGAYMMTLYLGGLDAVNAVIPDSFRQSAPQDRGLSYEVFADAFTCWAHPDCEFTDVGFANYFNDLMTTFALDRANH